MRWLHTTLRTAHGILSDVARHYTGHTVSSTWWIIGSIILGVVVIALVLRIAVPARRPSLLTSGIGNLASDYTRVLTASELRGGSDELVATQAISGAVLQEA